VTAPDAPELDPRRWKALTVTLVAGFMSLLDVSIVSVALPSIQAGLGTTPAGVQWVVSGYALAFGLALVPAGRLGDALGRRRCSSSPSPRSSCSAGWPGRRPPRSC
jgi:MFS family permease